MKTLFYIASIVLGTISIAIGVTTTDQIILAKGLFVYLASVVFFVGATILDKIEGIK